mgnify:CR=1 FL=1
MYMIHRIYQIFLMSICKSCPIDCKQVMRGVGGGTPLTHCGPPRITWACGTSGVQTSNVTTDV